MPSYYCDSFDLTTKPETTHLLLAEGFSEVGFIDAYLASLGADARTTTILCFKGLGNVRGKTDTLVKFIEKGPSGLDQLRGIGVMGDCEDNPSGQLDVAIQLATSLGFTKPAREIRDTRRCEQNGRRFGVFLSPAHNTKGRIEDLVVSEAAADPIFACLETSFACIEGVLEKPVDTKARVQMLISAKANSNLTGIRRAFEAKIFAVSAAPYAEARSMVDYVLAAT